MTLLCYIVYNLLVSGHINILIKGYKSLLYFMILILMLLLKFMVF